LKRKKEKWNEKNLKFCSFLFSFQKLVAQGLNAGGIVLKKIQADLDRTFPTHPLFLSTGVG
jgi:hypothetical protein